MKPCSGGERPKTQAVHPASARYLYVYTQSLKRKHCTGGAQVTRQVSKYGIKVSSWGSETFKIVIPVENHPQKPKTRLADYHPSGGC
eukprot:scaffold76841_cov69-Phaeocystis_antarctica.AAC.2